MTSIDGLARPGLALLLYATSFAVLACDATHSSAVVKDCSLEASQENATTSNAFWTSDLDDHFYSGYCNFDFCQVADQHTGNWWIGLQPYKSAATSNFTFSVSQSVTLPSAAHQVLSYWLKMDSCVAADKLKIFLGSTLIKTHNCVAAGYTQFFVDVSAYKSTTQLLKFSGNYAHVGPGFSTTVFAIDDVDITVGTIPVATTTTLTASPNPATPGVAVALTATVTGTAPTGTVQFKHGTAIVSPCSAVTLNASHQAVCADVSSLLQTGSNAFSAAYSGNAGNLSSSGQATVTLNKSASTTVLSTACSTTFTAGQPFSMTAVVSGYAPTGAVAFQTGAATIPGCESVQLDANSQAVCATDAWTAGGGLLSAAYAGDAFDVASTSGSLMIDVLDPDDVLFRTFFDETPPACPAH